MGRLEKPVRRAAILVAVTTIFVVLAASASAAPFAYTTNLNLQSTVSVVDTATNSVVGEPIPVGDTPEAMAITPNGATAYVANRRGDSVSVISTAAHAVVKTIQVGSQPVGVAISPDGNIVYVSLFGEERVALISTATDAVIGGLEVDGEPAASAVTPDGKFIWVPRKVNSEGSIEIFDAQTRLPVGSIETREESYRLVFTPDGREAFLIVNDPEPEIWVIDTALRQVVKKLPVGNGTSSIAISPDGHRAYVSGGNQGVVWILDTTSNERVGSIPVGAPIGSISLTPNGKTAYVAAQTNEELFALNLTTGQKDPGSLALPGRPEAIVVAPDQSPTAAFTVPSVTATLPAVFSGAASTDPDGTVAGWSWSFGDGGLASGLSVTHSFGAAGTYGTKLSVVDDEGCGEAPVFTGQTAYCSGNVGAAVTHPVSVAALPVARPTSAPPSSRVCPSALRIGRVVHNRRNGTARLQVKVPGTGSLYLFGRKIHAVTRRSVGAGSTFLTVHARVEVNRRLKKTRHTGVRYRVTFFPTAGCSPTTVHRSLALLRAPKKKGKKKH